jgi:citrate lyase subunit beta/citryl-CoA lyase
VLTTIRVNALATGLALDDVRATFACRPDAYVVPKVEHPDDIRAVSRCIAALESSTGTPPGSVRLVPIVTEHPRAVLCVDALCAADPRVASVMVGVEDLCAALGARSARDEHGAMLDVVRTARSLALLAASAHGLPAIDTPVTTLDALDDVEREARSAAAMGFAGKAAIHPAHVAAIHRGFAPGDDELAYARDVIDAASRHAGAFRFRGRMIDAPHVKAARRILARAAPAS